MNKLRYIPGDLVYQKDDEGHWNIISLSALNLALINYKNIKPIPLTPEILKKNGWKQNGGQYSFNYKPYAGNKVELIGFFIEMFKDVHDMLKHRYFQITHEDKVFCGCFYVHQLQHLFFGLGINY